MANFDPYYHWLGISPTEQPPDHYRLLGILRFEEDPTVIENAADRQMSHLKTFQAGPRSVESQRLLNEVSAARVCLLSSDKKIEYDEWLHQTLQAVTPSQSESLPSCDHTDTSESEGNYKQDFATIKVGNKATGRKSRHKRRMLTSLALVATTVVILVLIGVCVPVAKVDPLETGRPNPYAGSDPIVVPQPTLEVEPIGHEPVQHKTVDTDTPHVPPPTAPVALPKQTQPKQLGEANPPDDSSPDHFAMPPGIGQDDSSHDHLAQPSGVEQDNSSQDHAVQDHAVPVESKRPVPSTADQKKVAKLMEDVYDFASAKTPSAQTALAERIFHAAGASKDSSEVFVLLNRSAELAADGGDAQMIFRAVDEIGRRYEGETSALYLKLLRRHVTSLDSPSGLNMFAAVCNRRIDDHLEEGQYKAAYETAKLIYQSTQRLRNKEFRKQALLVYQTVSKLYKEYQKFLQAKEKLASAPADAEANLCVGCWYCLKKNDWKKGVPFLAKGGDVALAVVAKNEIDLGPQPGSRSSAEQVAVGDAWWDLAEKTKTDDAVNFRGRAMHWYALAKTRLSGLDKARVEKRLESFEQLAEVPSTVDSLAELMGDSLANRWKSARTKKHKPIKWKAVGRCDNEYDMFVNGKRVLGGRNYHASDKGEFQMSRGDIITVRCADHGGARGFCCVLLSEKGQVIVSGAAWKSYQPADVSQWFDPKKIVQTAPPLPGNAGMAVALQKETGVVVQEIWGHGEPCYLMFQVP